MSEYPRYYDNLGVARRAPDTVIRAAYKALIQQYHPDKFQGSEQEALRLTKLIRQAYEILIDPIKRAEYDQLIAEQEAATKKKIWGTEFDETPEDTVHQYHQKQDNDTTHEPPPPRSSTPGSANSNYRHVQLAKAWARFFARIFDVWCEILITGFFLAVFLGGLSTNFIEWFNQPSADYFFNILCLPIALLLDASLYYLFGNTPGKALLGLKVITLSGEPLKFKEYLHRNFLLWKSGFAFGIPLFNLYTMEKQFRRIKKGQQASYDEFTGHQVCKQPTTWIRKTLCVFTFTLLFIVQSVINSVDRLTRHEAKYESSSKISTTRPKFNDLSLTKQAQEEQQIILQHNIKINSNCRESISTAITYWNGFDWVTIGWWILQPYTQTDTGLKTKLKEIYIYGESANYVWRGKAGSGISRLVVKNSFTSSSTNPITANDATMVLFSSETITEKIDSQVPYFELTLTCQSEIDAHFEKIKAAYPDYEKVTSGRQFSAWIESQPQETKSRFEKIRESGTADEVIALLNAYEHYVINSVNKTKKHNSGSDNPKLQRQQNNCLYKPIMSDADYANCGLSPPKN
jgi:uncharacterized RDD family membrane protein YckC